MSCQGRAIVMVTSHDCHPTKNGTLCAVAFCALATQSRRRTPAQMRTRCSTDTSKRAHSCPSKTFHHQARQLPGWPSCRLLPVPASPDGAFPESVVDLTYRCTIDKQAISNRRWCLAPEGRDQLRYAIARFDSFRSVELSETIEAAVGRTITSVAVDNSNRLIVDLTLDDGTVLHLVQPPSDPDPSGEPRSDRALRGATSFGSSGRTAAPQSCSRRRPNRRIPVELPSFVCDPLEPFCSRRERGAPPLPAVRALR